jgi:hypothetical protein
MHGNMSGFDVYVTWWIVAIGALCLLVAAASEFRDHVRRCAVRRARSGRTVNLTTRRSL